MQSWAFTWLTTHQNSESFVGMNFLAERFGPKNVLLTAMILAVASFGLTLTLGPGDWLLFAVICVASGASGAYIDQRYQSPSQVSGA